MGGLETATGRTGRLGLEPEQRMGSESSLKRSVVKWMKEHYPCAVVRKRHGSVYTIAGDPDLYFLIGGVHIECELKRPGEQPTPLQRHRLAEWARAGAHTVVVHSVPELAAFLRGLLPIQRAGAALEPPLRRLPVRAMASQVAHPASHPQPRPDHPDHPADQHHASDIPLAACAPEGTSAPGTGRPRPRVAAAPGAGEWVATAASRAD